MPGAMRAGRFVWRSGTQYQTAMKSTVAAVLLAAAVAPAPVAAFDLQGHRGARGLAPENTLPAFATALGIGVTTLEFDVVLTRDDLARILVDLRA